MAIKARYIRDWTNGSTANGGDHWVEIKAYTFDGVNVSSGKTAITTNGSWDSSYGNVSELTNGDINSRPYLGVNNAGPTYVQLDLGRAYYLETIYVWHFYDDGRTYYETKTEVSENGTDWVTIFDSATDGTYQETRGGHRIKAFSGDIISADEMNSTRNEIKSEMDSEGVNFSWSSSWPVTKDEIIQEHHVQELRNAVDTYRDSYSSCGDNGYDSHCTHNGYDSTDRGDRSHDDPVCGGHDAFCSELSSVKDIYDGTYKGELDTYYGHQSDYSTDRDSDRFDPL